MGRQKTEYNGANLVGAYNNVLPVNMIMAPMIASVELAITRETMLRWAPNCAPSIRQDEEETNMMAYRKALAGQAGRQKRPGSTPTAMRPPSSGGSGNILKTANTILMISAFFKFSATHCTAVTGQEPTRWKASAAENKIAMLMTGPDPRTVPLRGFRSARKLTGTGLA